MGRDTSFLEIPSNFPSIISPHLVQLYTTTLYYILFTVPPPAELQLSNILKQKSNSSSSFSWSVAPSTIKSQGPDAYGQKSFGRRTAGGTSKMDQRRFLCFFSLLEVNSRFPLSQCIIITQRLDRNLNCKCDRGCHLTLPQVFSCFFQPVRLCINISD